MKKFLWLLWCLPINTFAQITYSAYVLNAENHEAVSYANIRLGTNQNTSSTNEKGYFSISKLPSVENEIHIHALGYEDKILKIKANKTTDTLYLTPKTFMNDAVIVQATRAPKEMTLAKEDIQAADIEKYNLGQDLPILLESSVSAVTTSDAGNGVGYTGIRIRGNDATRTNVTINGVPFTDAESHQSYWVDIPDIASSTENIEIQRGLGFSTQGGGSLGATVSLQTNQLNEKAFLALNNYFGSFNTLKNTISASTGLLKNHFVADARFSHIRSDGYIDRAKSKLLSGYLSLGYYHKNHTLRLNIMSGHEKTYQAWYGVDEATLKTNRTFNVAGTDYYQKEPPYNNETDNYGQTHVQAIWAAQLHPKWKLNTVLFYTHGQGYYEQYKVDAYLPKYGMTAANDTVSGDVVRQRWLKNDFYGGSSNLNWKVSSKILWDVGLGWNQYKGNHFGKLRWAENALTINTDYHYYDAIGLKTDFNVYLKMKATLAKSANLFLDLQYRNVGYNINGDDNDGQYVFITDHLNFFNPKMGLEVGVWDKNKVSFYVGYGNREPIRDDYKALYPNGKPKAESLLDGELGYNFSGSRLTFAANYYMMYYFNQLVPTGELNDVGALIRENVKRSYRTGLEFSAQYKPLEKLLFDVNTTLSINRILNYDETVYTYDDDYVPVDSLQMTSHFASTPIAFSPSAIIFGRISYLPVKGFNISLDNKYVSKQFLDNTGSKTRMLNGYFVNNLNFSYSFSSKWFDKMEFIFAINNLTNRKYSSNGYTYRERYVSGGELSDVTDYNYYYPQARINYMLGMNVRF